MGEIKVGDIVGRKSHCCDLFFKVTDIYHEDSGKHIAVLKGIDHRLIVTCPMEDLMKINYELVQKYWEKVFLSHVEKAHQIIQHNQNLHQTRKNKALKCSDDGCES